MSKRAEHTFQFEAGAIETAASQEAAYHEDRASYWRKEQERAAEAAIAGAQIELHKFPVTGGDRIDLAIKYGDAAEYGRMQEAFTKAERHRQAAERYRTDQRIYGSQNGRTYELDSDDVHHFRLGGEPRED